jgi:hypothetical protein
MVGANYVSTHAVMKGSMGGMLSVHATRVAYMCQWEGNRLASEVNAEGAW